MSGDAEPVGEPLQIRQRRASGGFSEVEEELQLHLDLIVEQLIAEGYGRADAEAEARRRFGNIEAVAMECTALKSGPMGIALRWLTTSTSGLCAVGALGVVAVLLTGDPWLGLVGVLMPIAAGAGGCALAAVRHEGRTLVTRAGHRLLGLLLLLAVTNFFFSDGDWMHSLWSVQFPMIGWFLGSGLLLTRVWPEDRAPASGPAGEWNGALLALISLLILGLLTFALMGYRADPGVAGDGAPLHALAEVVQYGFGGDVPASMQPVDHLQVKRGLGVPPRMVTVTMGSTMVAMIVWTVFVLLALVGKAIWDARWRRRFLLTAPLFIAPVLLLWSVTPLVYEGLWRNEPWFVKVYGPVLLLAVASSLALLLTLRRSKAAGR